MNAILIQVLRDKGYPIPEKPVIQRNQNQSAVGGHDLTNPFGLGIEVKRQEQLAINTWWLQCLRACEVNGDIPILVYRRNKQKWAVIMFVEVPLLSGTTVNKVRAEFSWEDFLRWFYMFVCKCIDQGLYPIKQ